MTVNISFFNKQVILNLKLRKKKGFSSKCPVEPKNYIHKYELPKPSEVEEQAKKKPIDQSISKQITNLSDGSSKSVFENAVNSKSENNSKSSLMKKNSNNSISKFGKKARQPSFNSYDHSRFVPRPSLDKF